MDLQKIDVGEFEAFKGGIDCVEYRCTRKATLVDIVTLITQVWVEDGT